MLWNRIRAENTTGVRQQGDPVLSVHSGLSSVQCSDETLRMAYLIGSII